MFLTIALCLSQHYRLGADNWLSFLVFFLEIVLQGVALNVLSTPALDGEIWEF